MALKTTPAEYAEKWGRNLTNARPDIERGVNRVTEAPGQKAAASVAKMRANILEAIDSGRWAAGVASVSLEDWKTKTLEKGLARLDSGVNAALGKVQEIATQNLANIESVKNEVDRMPNTSFQDRIQRMVAFSTKMHGKRIKK